MPEDEIPAPVVVTKKKKVQPVIRYSDVLERMKVAALYQVLVISTDATGKDLYNYRRVSVRWNQRRYTDQKLTYFRVIQHKNVLLFIRVQ